ncbi:Regulatory protein BlaR1 [Posidoniimonas polymericola]|uniref:Regulatory protein BlaR1 n=1 Tax=Posidoniimonas polymericola TaxID=2528002 RepID=A0A5C5ZE92_9BACT|nr:M56 family metallopeptidase [Posidoniimonas polymericola]TWT85470.1 Regulatory protein BlaR1 [Posidoniimonas polymericola]
MNFLALFDWMDQTVCTRVCLTLLHSLWQFAVLAGVALLVERLARRVEATYATQVGLLLVGLTALPATYLMIGEDAATAVAESAPVAVHQSPTAAAPSAPQEFVIIESEVPAATAPPVVAPRAGNAAPQDAEPAVSWQTVSQWLLVAYLAGVLLMLTRLAAALLHAHRLAARATPVAVGRHADYLRRIAERWNMAAAPALAMIPAGVTPKVVGLMKPTILLPGAALAGMTCEELELILRHELAHVRRHDMWANLMQRLAEALLFFNPAVWLLSRRISTFREYCCDELACETAAEQNAEELDPRSRYAAALVRVVELSRGAAPAQEVATLAAAGGRPSELRRRVARLFGEPQREPLRLSRGGLLAVGGLAVLLALPLANSPASEKQSATEALEGRFPEDDSTEQRPSSQQPITGRVVLAETSEAVADAEVRLLSWPKIRRRYSVKTTRTDAQGFFRFDEYEEGDLKLAAYKGRKASRTKRYDGFDVEPGNKLIQLGLQDAPSLKVTVKSKATGDPIPDARVRLTWTDGDRDHQTDDQGEVTIHGLTAEVWTIEVQAAGFAKDGQAISLQPEQLAEVTSLLAPGFELRGVVRDTAGAPLAGVGFSVFPASMRGGQIEWLETNANGEYSFPFLPRQPLKLMLSKDGFADTRLDLLPGLEEKPSIRDFELSKRPDGGSVTGIVTTEDGQPIAGARVVNQGNSSDDQRETVTDSEGRFRLDDVFQAVSGHELFIRAEGFASRAVNFEPGPADNPAVADVTLELGRRIAGQVVDEAGTAVEGVRVYYAEGNRWPGMLLGGQADTDANGRFQFNSLPVDCPFTFTKQGYSQIEGRKLPLNGKEEVLVTLLDEGVLSGQAIDDQSGEPVTPITVHITFSPDRTKEDPGSSLTGARATGEGERFATADGAFRFGDLVRGMPLQVTVKAEGYHHEVMRRLVAAKEEDAAPVTFRMRRIDPAEQLRVAGRLVDQDQAPRAGVDLWLIVSKERPSRRDDFPFNWEMIESGGLAEYADCQQFLSATTDAKGEFVFEQVTRGNEMEIAYSGAGVARGRFAGVDKLTSDALTSIVVPVIEGGVVHAQVDPEAYPTADAVILMGKDGAYYPKHDGASRSYRADGLPPGEYEIQLYGRLPRNAASPSELETRVLERKKIRVRSGETTEVKFGPNQAGGEPKPGEQANDTSQQQLSQLRVLVVDEAGQPIPGATVRQNHVIHTPGGPRATTIKNQLYQTDADGWAVVEWTGKSKDLRLWASAPEHVTMHAMWAEELQRDGDRIPLEFGFELPGGTEIGGRVVDADGAPIEGAEVTYMDIAITWAYLDTGNLKRVVRPVRVADGPTVKTDADGRWTMNVAPSDKEIEKGIEEGRRWDSWLQRPPRPLLLKVNHPLYADFHGGAYNRLGLIESPPLAELRSKEAVVVLQPLKGEAAAVADNAQHSDAAPQPALPAEPEKPSPPLAPPQIDAPEFRVVIAKHVLLLNGKEIVTWAELKQRMKAAGDPAKLQPSFYVTRGWREGDESEEAAGAAMMLLREQVGFDGHSVGSLWPRTDLRYDRIEDAEDLTPENPEAVEGTVVDAAGEPVAGAEVLLVTPIDESIGYRAYHVALVSGRVRNPLEHVMTTTGADGRFRLQVEAGTPYRLLVLHPAAGYRNLQKMHLPEDGKIALLEWGTLQVGVDAEEKPQTVDLSTRVTADDPLPEIVINQYWSDQGQAPVDATFTYRHVPPIVQTAIQRSVPTAGGGATSVHGASVSLLPGEEQSLSFGPLSTKQREQIESMQERFSRRVED